MWKNNFLNTVIKIEKRDKNLYLKGFLKLSTIPHDVEN